MTKQEVLNKLSELYHLQRENLNNWREALKKVNVEIQHATYLESKELKQLVEQYEYKLINFT